MSDTSIIVTDLHKKYDLGTINSGTIKDDLKIWWAKKRGRDNPIKKIGESDSEKEFWALKNVSFEVKKGDTVGIIGRNGAGKSTLLKILSRVTTPTYGSIKVNGRIASLLEVGTGFHPDLTGRENIFMNGSILGMTRKEIYRNLDEIIGFSGVERHIDTPVKRYSSGMYVRLAFAVAAHLEPEILIVDEVLAVGDLEFQRKCLGKMGEVAKQGRTVLFVSHNMPAVQKLCKTGILLKQGSVLSSGEIGDVISAYLDNREDNLSSFIFNEPEPSEKLAAYATSLEIEDINGNQINEIPVGSSWQMRLKFTVTQSMDHFIAAIGMVTSGEVPLRTCWSLPHNIKPGKYEAVFKEETVHLATGLYQLVIGLSTHLRSIQFIEGKAFLTISEVLSSSEQNQVVKSDQGLILNPMEIIINKIN